MRCESILLSDPPPDPTSFYLAPREDMRKPLAPRKPGPRYATHKEALAAAARQGWEVGGAALCSEGSEVWAILYYEPAGTP